MTEKKILKALSLEELNEVTGGRLVRMNEWDSYSEALRKAMNKQRKIRSANPEEATQYMNRFDAQYEKWINDIGNAPEGSSDIMFDNYWNEQRNQITSIDIGEQKKSTKDQHSNTAGIENQSIFHGYIYYILYHLTLRYFQKGFESEYGGSAP